jgi:hypothetical protein
MGETKTYACGGHQLAEMARQPVVLTYRGKTARGEFHYSGRSVPLKEASPKPYDVYITVEGTQTRWRLQEEQKLHQGSPIGRNSFAGLELCKPQTIAPDHLIEKNCSEGDCNYLYLAREGVTLVLGTGPTTVPAQLTGATRCRFEPNQPPKKLSLYFHSPECEESDLPPHQRGQVPAK